MKRYDTVEQAQAKKAAIDTAGGMLTDEQAVKVSDLYDLWAAGVAYKVDDRRRYGDRLYKCRQAHTSEAQHTPDLISALWVVIDETHAGTVDDPIPAARGMVYEAGKYYLDPEDGKVYLCTRSETLQYLPHELVGHYFEATN